MLRPESDIAVVGMACRFAEARDHEQFWRNVLAARASFTDVPKGRWRHEDFHSKVARDVDKTYATKGAFIDDVEQFAALHYGIAPRRVEVMDPQHRLLIDAVREALQDAGLEKRSYDRKGVGTFVGVSSSEYRNILQSRVLVGLMNQGQFGRAPSKEEAEALSAAVEKVVPVRAFSIAGTLLNMAAASVAQQWDFGGPAYTIDAACASALVAVYDAMLYLRAGKVDMALAGGLYLNLTPENLIGFARIGAISAQGACRPFDAEADGMLQGDGIGVVVLKRLADARRDGDRVYAVIRGGGCNNDGRGEGPMTPRQGGQVDAIERAYADVKDFGPDTVGYVECHGTATTVGDPVEVDALREVFGRDGASGRPVPVRLGSVKANVGHTMSAAGIAGLIKTVKVLERKTIPPQAGFRTPNPLLRLEGSPFQIPTAPIPWDEERGHPRRAGVSSFGFGGTNCHLLVEEATPDPRPARKIFAPGAQAQAEAGASDAAAAVAPGAGLGAGAAPRSELLVATAPSRALLAKHLGDLAAWLEGPGAGERLPDVAYTLNATRQHEAHRVAVVARDHVELAKAWRSAAERLAAGGELPLKLAPGVWLSPKGGAGVAPKVSFLFPGQGAQRVGLLRHFFVRFPRFRARLGALAAATDGLLERPLLHYLYPELGTDAPSREEAEERLTATEVCQPAMAALGIALAELLEELGVKPAVTAGHSLGEFAAAAAGGLLAPEDAVRFVARRGLAMRGLGLADAGAMAAVMADRATVERELGANAQVVVANVNHPRQTVISGTTPGVLAAIGRFEAEGIEATRLSVSHAFHSPVLEAVAGPVARLVEELEVGAARVPVVSAISRDVYPESPAAVRAIMARHATAPVDFVAALEKVVEAGATVHVQVGAGTTLCAFAAQTIPASKHAGIVTLSAVEDDGGQELARALGLLAVLGQELALERLCEGEEARPVSLPATPIATQPYWAVKDTMQPRAKFVAGGERERAAEAVDGPAVGLAPAAAAAPSAPSAEMVALFREQMALLRSSVEIIQRQQAALGIAGAGDGALGALGAALGTALPAAAPAPGASTGAVQPAAVAAGVGAATTARAAATAAPRASAPVASIDKVMEIVSVVSAFPRDALRPDQSLAGDLGFDSLMVVDLGAGIEAAFPDVGGLPQSLFVNKTTIADVAGYIDESLKSGKGTAPKAPAATAGRALERYRAVLEERPLPDLPPAALEGDGAVIVTRDARGVAERVAARLAALGRTVVLARLGGPVAIARDGRTIEASAPDAEALFRALAAAAVGVSGVVHVAPLGEAMPLEEVLRGPGRWPNPVPAAQALARALGTRGTPAFFGVVTGMGGGLGLDGRGDAASTVWHAGLVGFAKALAREWPDAVVKAIDLDPAGSPEALAGHVVDELRAGDATVEVGWAAGARRAVALAPAPFDEKGAPYLGEKSVVVVTGGGRGIGAKAAIDLARHYRPRLVICGTQPAPAPGADTELARNLRAMEAAGARVSYMQWDVSDSERAPAVLDEIRRTAGPITAVVHAAGIIKDRLVTDKDPAELARVMDVKVAGFLNLLRVAAPDRLRLVVSFSSWSGRFGNARQTDYAAANELLNRLAGVVGRLLPDAKVVSIAWPPWEDSAMVRSIPELVRNAMRAEGVTFATDEQGVQALRRELESTGGGEVLYGLDLPARTGTIRAAVPLALDTHPYLRDHRLGEHAVLPLAAALDYAAGLAIAAAGAAPGAPLAVRDFRLFQGVQVIDRTQLALEARYRTGTAGGAADVELEIRQGATARSAGTLAYRGTAATAPETPARLVVPAASAAGAVRALPLSLDDFYARHTFHGPLLRGVERIEEIGDRHVIGWVCTSTPRAWIPGATRARWAVDPLALDASFQLCGYWAWVKHRRAGFPLGFAEYVQLRPFGDGPVRCTIVLGEVEGDQFTGSIQYEDAEGRLLARLGDVQAQFREVAARREDAPAPAPEAAAAGNGTGNGHGNGHGAPIPEEHWNIEKFAEVEALSQRLQMAELFGLKNPYFSVHEGVARDTSVIEGRGRLVNYSSYNYLGLSGHPEVTATVIEAVKRYGTSVSASRVASGEKPVHRELETAIAEFLGCEASLVFVSGHATNVTVVGHLLGEGDLILHDQLAHDSILQGAFLSGAKRRPFPHSDWRALERTLESLRSHYNKVMIAIEGVYSMDGDVPDLPRFMELREKYRCLLLVDEAHSLGVLGETGRGVGEHFGVDRKGVDVWMGTLSKSLASCGGYVAGSRALVEYLKYTAPGFVYSAGISPANAAAAAGALRQIVAHPEEVRRLHANCRLFLDLARRRGVNTGMTDGSAVIPCIVGNSIQCLKLSQRLGERGINVQPIIYPAVEDDAARLRFFLSSSHTEEQIRTTIDVLAEELAKLATEDGAIAAAG